MDKSKCLFGSASTKPPTPEPPPIPSKYLTYHCRIFEASNICVVSNWLNGFIADGYSITIESICSIDVTKFVCIISVYK
jgi:hypothetical protein